MMKRHLEWYTKPDQSLKDRSRFWTWYMRGLHGDMDTRYEGDRSCLSRASSQVPSGRHVYTSSAPSGFNFRPLASNTYGYHPKGVSLTRRPDAGIAAQQAAAQDLAPAMDRKRPNWSTPLKSLDDVMLMREPTVGRSTSVPPRRSHEPLKNWPLTIDPALDDLLSRRTWRETRTASPEEIAEAEKALNKLKALIGYCKPYDRHCHDAINQMENCIRGVGKSAAQATSSSPPEHTKMVTFDDCDPFEYE